MSSEPGLGRGDLFVICAPSGTGKTTLIKRLFEHPWPRESSAPEFSVSHTSRAPRPDEVDGRNYHFVSDESFDAMVAEGQFLEWAMVHGQRKGTSRTEVAQRLAEGRDVLLDIDIQGADSVLALHPEACSILILPPSYEELRRRISERGHDAPEDVARRLAVSLSEIERYATFDYVIINDDLECAGTELVAVIVAWRSRIARRRGRVQAIVENFRTAPNPNAPDDR